MPRRRRPSTRAPVPRLLVLLTAVVAVAIVAAGGFFVWSHLTGRRAPLLRHAEVEAPEPPAPRPPEALQDRITALGKRFEAGGKNEHVGIAIRDVQAGWTAGYNARDWFPQQSVSKLWVAITILDLVDRHELHLEDTLLVRRQDLSVFFQPIRRCVGQNGYRASVDELLTRAIGESDNTANDMLMRRAGGPEAVSRLIHDHGVRGLRTGVEEKDLQSSIAGMTWRPEYGEGWNFQQAREQLPYAYRDAKLKAYLADPLDGATPAGMTGALARLERRELLSPASTAHLLGIMERSLNGPRRLKGGLPTGWRLAHKTGTGQDFGGLSTGYNDVGVVSAPDGRAYAVAVMIGSTRRPIAARMAFMTQVARELVAFHDHAAPPAEQTPELSENSEESRPLSTRVRCNGFSAR